MSDSASSLPASSDSPSGWGPSAALAVGRGVLATKVLLSRILLVFSGVSLLLAFCMRQRWIKSVELLQLIATITRG